MVELDDQGRSSIEQEIFRRASQKGISKRRINEVFEQKLNVAEGLFQNISKAALLQYAEYSVWVHFFDQDPYPGKIHLPSAPPSSSSPFSEPSVLDQKQIVQLSSEIRGSARMDMLFGNNLDNRKTKHGARDDQAWVHDKYKHHNNPDDFEGDFYRPGRLYTEIDSYQPEPRGRENRRPDLFDTDSYEPESRGRDNRRPDLFEKQPLIEEQRYARIYHGARETAMSVPFPRAEPRDSIIPRRPSSSYSNVLPITHYSTPLVSGRVNNPSSSLLRSPRATALPPPFATGANSSHVKPSVVLLPKDPEPLKQHSFDLSAETASYQEEFLKEKVLGLGYGSHQFYKYLQDARMQANEEHPGCSQGVKHYFANSAVWERFVKENYPGSAPRGGHNRHCPRKMDFGRDLAIVRRGSPTGILSDRSWSRIARSSEAPIKVPVNVHSSGRSSSRIASLSESMVPIKDLVKPLVNVHSSDRSSSRVRSSGFKALIKSHVNPSPVKAPAKPPVKSPTTSNGPKSNVPPFKNTKPVALLVPETTLIDLKTTQNKLNQAYLIVQGRIMKCGLEDLKNISFAWVMDSNRSVVEQSLDCKFNAIQRTPESGLHLSAVRAEGYSSSIVEDNGAQFLNKWVSKVLEGEPITMSVYWTQHAADHGFTDFTMGTNCGPPSSPIPIKGSTGANTIPVTSLFRNTPASFLEEAEDLADEEESEVEIYCGEPSVSTWGMKRKGDNDGYSQVEKKARSGSV